MPIAYFITGGNQGDRKQLLELALLRMQEQIGTIVQVSAIFESEAWGFNAEESFLNQILVIETSLSPENILLKTREIEAMLGRKRGAETGYTSRTMDIDILFYDDQIIAKEDLVIPHPRIRERRFVLLPLVSINPLLIHPTEHKTVWQLLRECADTGWVREINR